MDFSAEDLIEAKNTLYTLLTSYTGGAVKVSIRRGRPKGIFESYRSLHFEGLRLTPKTAFQDRAALWRTEEVTTEKLSEAIDKWESQLDYVEEQQDYSTSNLDKVQVILSLCPSSLRARLLEEQGKGVIRRL